jgi:hypothetical protein
VTDFLGPNIDAGFRLAAFARKKQLVVSPGLAAYLIDKNCDKDRFRIAGFERLKGIAKDALYPGLWYRESWETLSGDFTYQERHSDPLVRVMSKEQDEDLGVLDEVRKYIGRPYFFDPDVLDEVMCLT